MLRLRQSQYPSPTMLGQRSFVDCRESVFPQEQQFICRLPRQGLLTEPCYCSLGVVDIEGKVMRVHCGWEIDKYWVADLKIAALTQRGHIW